jgi:endonuclease/exonuclease/phosphatase family metal-dependent hydrolase
MRVSSILVTTLVTLGACQPGNYVDVRGPRFVGGPTTDDQRGRNPDTLVVASFNIAFSRQIDSAIAVLRSDSMLRRADILLLQEMDDEGTRRVAEAMHMRYVYYPAIRHYRTKRDFGNAILSAWPIESDAKVILPHISRYAHTQRIATAATILVGNRRIRVYSTHLSTIADAGTSSRRNQLRTIAADAEGFPFVILGGDLNSRSAGESLPLVGYSWPTADGPRTTLGGRWDHVFLKGLRASGSGIVDDRGASDHKAIWVRVVRVEG